MKSVLTLNVIQEENLPNSNELFALFCWNVTKDKPANKNE